MPRFAKQVSCTPSPTLAALAAGTLPPLARQSAELHARSCDFCAAELQLLGAAAPEVLTPEPPPLPLALRLFAESKLAESDRVARRAA
ncbi:MAG TPA: hypothetical protein VK421_01610 [Pyrinomonadaceae bacterium]|nr:hypothetical protein [Pyrinomonadaceae bacterium]